MSGVDEVACDTKKDETMNPETAQSGHSVTGSGTPRGQPLEEGAAAFPSVSVTPTPSVRNSSKNVNSASAKQNRQFGWWWEIWAALLGLTSTVLITAILFSMDGKPLRNWKTAVLHPNSLVAIFATIAKTAL